MSMASRTLSAALLVLLLSSAVVAFNGQAASAQSLSVTISSPGSGAVFNRGESVTVTAAVSSAGSPVSGATVTATNPTGGKIALSEATTPGTYSGQYAVQAADPVGPWTISVQAINNGDVASTHTTVSISGSLVVSVASPPAGSMLNVGESATVKATVTYQDGSPLPPAALVSFANPSGGAVPMTVDSADSSGKTWTGTYTILASDVPADGVTWSMTASATSSGNTGSSVRTASLFKTLVVGVSTFGSSDFSTPQTNFQVGQTVYVKAAVGLHDATTVSSGTVSFTISGTTIFSTSMPMTYVLSMNSWTGSYTIQSADQQGAQTVTVTATDASGNAGRGTQQITIGAQGLTVSMTSPPAGSIFNRGQVATISASVAVAGTPATAATVTANSPSGGTISLANLGSGAYSAYYTIFSIDPPGTWLIAAQAIQGGLTGSSQVAVTISSQLRVAASTWSSSSFTVPQSTYSTGQTVFVKAQVSLQGGAVVPAGTVTFTIGGTGIASAPMAMTFSNSLNAWVGSYTLVQSDQAGTQAVTVAASDGNGNSGSGTQSISIAPAINPQQPLEAAITFNPTNQDVQVNAICNPGCVGPTSVTMTNTLQATSSGHGNGHSDGHGKGSHGDGGGHGKGALSVRTYVIADSAGHSITLLVGVKNDGHEVKARVLSIQYGGSAPVTSFAKLHNRLSFQYSVAKDGSLKTLEESAHAYGTAHVQAHFSADKGATTITTWPQGSHVGDNGDNGDNGSSITKSGLWLLELVTSNGALSVSYFQSQ
jgi:hypothetical protein